MSRTKPAHAQSRRRIRRRRPPLTPAQRSRRRPSIAVATLLAVLLGTAVTVSFVSALRAPGNLTASEKSVEWLRDHRMGALVNGVENWWFSNYPPTVGGEPARAIAETDGSAPPPSASAPSIAHTHTPKPTDVSSPADSTLPNEGVWQPIGATVDGLPAMYATQVRPDSVHTSLLEGLVWMDPKLLRFELHPGLQEPGGNWDTAAQVPMADRLDLAAAFNGGFRRGDANGGFYLDGREVKPLRDGAASLVITKNGSATVGEWGRDLQMTPDVVAVRQNLVLIVDHGQPLAGLDNNTNGAWGASLDNRVLVWRSGVCVDANGGLIFGYGPGLGAGSLAELLQRAGCDRAMELDINPSWTSFNFYGATTPGDVTSVTGWKMLPDQNKSARRYLSDDARDFISAFVRTP